MTLNEDCLDRVWIISRLCAWYTISATSLRKWNRCISPESLILKIPPLAMGTKLSGFQKGEAQLSLWSPARIYFARREIKRNQAGAGCQPASAHSSPLTAELEIMNLIASAISSVVINLPSWVYCRMFFLIKSSPRARTIGVSV